MDDQHWGAEVEMTTTTITPYINFEDNAREVFEFYKSVFGGELTTMTFGESPMETPPEADDLVMHADLTSDALRIMGSDRMPGMDGTVGDNFQLALGGDDEEKLIGYFNALSEGGSVTMPLEKQFWGDHFGMLVDKFGVQWMVNVSEPAG
jgi:PhnB protein